MREFLEIKILGLVKVLIYLVFYFYGEKALHLLVNPKELSYAALFAFQSVQWICAFGAVVEVVELVTRINLIDKFKELFEALWIKIKQKFGF